MKSKTHLKMSGHSILGHILGIDGQFSYRRHREFRTVHICIIGVMLTTVEQQII